jgi:hypothetical protein
MVVALDDAVQVVEPHVYVWTCAIDKDETLNDCFVPDIQP